MSAPREEIRRLRRQRPRSRFVRLSLGALVAVAVLSLLDVGRASAGFLTGRRLENFSRFLGEIRPWPLRHERLTFGAFARFALDYLRAPGLAATTRTLEISVAAAVLAGAVGLLLSFGAARNLVHPEPFAPAPRPPGRLARVAFRTIVSLIRSWCVLVRALPEYVWAFLLLAILGPSPWAAVLALALHNSGILGRLNAETIENLPRGAPSAWRLMGGSRAQIATGAIVPAVMPRFLLYFFYRWETCVREATVLGMLGIVSIGYYLDDVRARGRYDLMMLLIGMSAALVVGGDVVSAIARRIVRRA